ncbi:hypothetical protein CE91St62_39330 [Lachnospiraceae bacterium]|uniref:NADAR family protein n=1 Tax=Extibacter sp. GGCC_0201 TaxID=2731209 RepID=UPI001FB7DB40|nr:NADAR family protein [Extibacter sp. GGCC_0201]BDF35871.1 hypothetical protein CE91St61_39460 [Lachnospiraceae bacterium]BDF39872.1 hypothetical protein CE91St62_39330 [Lachnospiraceae bacterium]
MQETQGISKITSFRGKYAFLSNFYNAPIIYRGLRYANNEAAFQSQKTLYPKERLKFCSSQLADPAEAKRLGRRITLRPDWEKVKIMLMYEICMTKFHQHPELAQALLATDNALLIEENVWKDRYWGMCDGYGENNLGLILMDIRGKLRMDYQRAM